MPYKVRIAGLVLRRIHSWGLPDAVLVEVHLRLRERLVQQPALQLVSGDGPDRGMFYTFAMIDPDNRLCVHQFAFQVFYETDEETLSVTSGVYQRYFY